MNRQVIGHGVINPLADHDPGAIFLGNSFEPRGKVHRVSEYRIVEAQVGAHVAHAHDAGIDADADIDRHEFSALGLGLAVFNARRSGVHWRTLFRDETAGALDPENAQHYVRMLRRALVAGGFANCLFVSHVPEVWEQADTVLHVGGGRIE